MHAISCLPKSEISRYHMHVPSMNAPEYFGDICSIGGFSTHAALPTAGAVSEQNEQPKRANFVKWTTDCVKRIAVFVKRIADSVKSIGGFVKRIDSTSR